MEKPNVMKTKKLDLCVSCGICSAVCPFGAITMEYKEGQFFPKIDENKCMHCGLCLELCPGIDIDPQKLSFEHFSNDIFNGPCLGSYTAYSNDLKIRKNSTSGGLITNLIAELIKNKEFDAVFVLDFNKFDGTPIRLKVTDKINEIVNAAKSKYIPASVYNIIQTLKKEDNKKYIIIGVPCQIYGIKKFVRRFNISKKNLLFLGLFCDKTLNFNIIKYFEDTYKEPNEKLVKFEYRTKEKYGWPGNIKLYFNSGRKLIIDRIVRMKLKKFFQLNRCLSCTDKLNKLADISFGDCYIKGKGSIDGKSSIIVRTKKGKDIFDRYSYLFTLEKESIKRIRESQHLMDKKNNLEYAKILIKRYNLYPHAVSDYEISAQAIKKLLKLQRYIKWGKEYNISKIKYSLFLSKILDKLRTIGKITMAGIALGIAIVEDIFFIHQWDGRYIPRKSTRENIVIVGGQLFNKGAQAMMFTVVDQMKRRFPNKSIYLFSTQDFEREDEEKSMYKFNILPWDIRTKIELLSFWGKLFKKNNKYSYLKNNIREVIRNTDFFIDISGYTLSSQWGFPSSMAYLLNIIIAKKYLISYYIFPQSVGPFNYPIKYKILLYPLLKLYLRYPSKIFVRENEGLKCITKFTKKNVEKNYDIVLQNEGYDLANIYNKEIRFKDIKIEPNSVGIIPNLRVIERGEPSKIYSIYNLLINRLINAKKIVYILWHSPEDLEICEKIKNLFPDNNSVKLISNDLNAIELESIIKQFDFIVASRYHSIIHAYKNGVPALVIGWATKYFELLDNFDQLDYFFDGRNSIDIDEINNKLDKMVQNYKHERTKIIDKMNTVNKENIFDTMFESMEKRNKR